MKFVVDEAALQEEFSSSAFGFSLPTAISLLSHTHPSQPPESCDIPDQAAHYHILNL
jgi:hypothetical protein